MPRHQARRAPATDTVATAVFPEIRIDADEVDARLEPGTAVGRLLVSIPERLALIALAALLVISVTTTFGIFYEWLVLPAIVVLAVILWFFVPRVVIAPTKSSKWGTIAALVIALVWLVANAPFVAEWFNPTRDPGVYFLHGLWFADHPASTLSVVRAHTVIQGIPKLTSDLGIIHGGPTSLISLQGGDLLPGVIGAAYWLGHFRGALEINLVIGALGLVALYGLARRLIGPWWALVPELALGFSIAYMYFSRGPYSEIIMVLVGLATLTWLISGVQRGAIRDFVLAGVFTGVASSARIDGVLVGMGALLVIAVAGLGFVAKERRPKLFIGGIIYALVAAASTYVGVYDLYRNKPDYVHALGNQSRLLWAAAVAEVVVFVLIWLLGRWLDATRMNGFWRRTAPILGGVVMAIMIFWLSRPLWYVGHFAGKGGFVTIEELQRQENLPVDGTRSYEEQTMAWLGWYFAWPMVILAMFGFALMVWHGTRRRNLPLLMAALAPLTVAAVYFTNVGITPDQTWAFRRILPVITPGFLIASVVPVALAWRRFRSRWIRVGAIVAAALVAFGPIVTWNGLLIVKDGGNQRAEMQAICNVVGNSKEVLLVRDNAPINYSLAIMTACNTEVISVWSYDITNQRLRALHARTGDVPVIAFNQTAIPEPRRNSPPNLTVTVPDWNHYIDHLPDAIVSTTYHLLFGELKANGTVVAK